MVLIMTVNPGYGGQAFIESCVEKVREVRALCERKGVNPLVEVDGGINAETASVICEAGANVLVAGSSVFKGDHAANIDELRRIADASLAKRA